MNDNNKIENKILKIGLPSLHSRLHPKVMKILDLPCCEDSQRLVFCSELAVIFFLRPWDLPKMVELGYIDVAFCGMDTIFELEVNVSVYHQFKELQSPICFCKRNGVTLTTENSILIATEYPKIARDYLSRKYANYKLLHVHGAAEAYPHLEGISAIVDIVESGGTLRENNLHLVDEIFYTYPCLIHNMGFDLIEADLSVIKIMNLVAKSLN